MRIGIAKKGGSSTIVTPNSSIVTWTGSQTWQAHNAMGATATSSTDYVLNVLETMARPLVAVGINVDILGNPSANDTDINATSFFVNTTGSRPINQIVSASGVAWHTGTGLLALGYGAYNEFNLRSGSGGATEVYGSTNRVLNASANTITGAYGVNALIDTQSTGGITSAYTFRARVPSNVGGGVIAALYQYYSANLVGSSTNPYFAWYNGTGASAGVWRVNHLGIVAYYNPSFAVYTPGAANYERIVTQWTSDVAEIGTEAGGTGTKRVTRILGTGVELQIYSRVAAVAVASLPAAAAGLAGARATVNDSNAALTAGIGAIVAAGGANVVPVFCDGTNWRIG